MKKLLFLSLLLFSFGSSAAVLKSEALCIKNKKRDNWGSCVPVKKLFKRLPVCTNPPAPKPKFRAVRITRRFPNGLVTVVYNIKKAKQYSYCRLPDGIPVDPEHPDVPINPYTINPQDPNIFYTDRQSFDGIYWYWNGPKPITKCGVYKRGSYYLANDLSFEPTWQNGRLCLILGEDTFVDMRGHSIVGSGTEIAISTCSYGYGCASPNHIRVKNGFITNVAIGADLRYVNGGVVENMTFTNNSSRAAYVDIVRDSVVIGTTNICDVQVLARYNSPNTGLECTFGQLPNPVAPL